MTDFRKVFFDTAPFIYYLEDDGVYFDKVKKLFTDYREANFVTSTVTVGEYLTGAFKRNDKQNASDFRNTIEDFYIEVIPISWDIAEEAARIRAKFKGFKMMDSLQLAAAKIFGCDLFVSNDKQLKQYIEIRVLAVDDVQL